MSNVTVMTKEEKIIAEINLQITNLTIAQEEGFITEFGRGGLEYLEGLRSFIRELPNDEEPVSEDLEEAASRYAREEYNRKNPANLPDRCRGCYAPLIYAFRDGAEWQEEQMMKDAVEGTYDCDDDTSWVSFDGWAESSSEVGKKVKVIILKEE